jgi:hypothetical protein
MGGGEEGEYKATWARSRRRGLKRYGRGCKRGAKNVKRRTRRRKQARKTRFKGGNVRVGYEEDDRGVVPSKVRTGITQKQGLNPPTDPKRGTVGCGIAKNKK